MKRIISVLLAAACVLSLCACSGRVAKNAVYSAEDLIGKQVGILSDTTTYQYLSGFEDEGMNVRSYSDADVMLSDITAGLADCAVMDQVTADNTVPKYSKLKTIDEPVISEDYSMITALESTALLDVMNKAIDAIRQDGTIMSITDSYLLGTDYIYQSPEDIEYSGQLILAVNPVGKPFAYYGAMGSLTGMDVDIARAMCDYMGVELIVRDAGGDDLMEVVRSGKADFAMGRLVENDKDKELVVFSQAYYTCVQVIIVRKK